MVDFFQSSTFKSYRKDKNVGKRLKITESVLKIGMRAFLGYYKLGSLNEYITDIRTIGKNVLDTSELIICFDDLERADSSLKPKDLWGYINSLSDEQVKVLIIANEDLLLKEGNEYSDLKEKIIGRTVEYVPESDNIRDIFMIGEDLLVQARNRIQQNQVESIIQNLLADIEAVVRSRQVDPEFSFELHRLSIMNHLTIERLLEKLKDADGAVFHWWQLFLNQRYKDDLTILGKELSSLLKLSAAINIFRTESAKISGKKLRQLAIDEFADTLANICNKGLQHNPHIASKGTPPSFQMD